MNSLNRPREAPYVWCPPKSQKSGLKNAMFWALGSLKNAISDKGATCFGQKIAENRSKLPQKIALAHIRQRPRVPGPRYRKDSIQNAQERLKPPEPWSPKKIGAPAPSWPSKMLCLDKDQAEIPSKMLSSDRVWANFWPSKMLYPDTKHRELPGACESTLGYPLP